MFRYKVLQFLIHTPCKSVPTLVNFKRSILHISQHTADLLKFMLIQTTKNFHYGTNLCI